MNDFQWQFGKSYNSYLWLTELTFVLKSSKMPL